MNARFGLVAVVAIVSAATLAAGSGAQGTAGTRVVVPHGAPVQLVYTAATEDWATGFSNEFERAVQMAIERHPMIRGFAVQMNRVETLCAGDNAQAAQSIVGNTQNVGVIGHLCSIGFASALPTYEQAGVVAISGSATASWLHGSPQSTVFNRTAVVSDAAGDAGDLWLQQIATLPSIQRWAKEYEAEFGTALPGPFDRAVAALYFDSASLLLDRIDEVSRVVRGNLVISRPALAIGVRDTLRYPGVTCRITLDPSTGNRVNDQAALAHCATRPVARRLLERRRHAPVLVQQT